MACPSKSSQIPQNSTNFYTQFIYKALTLAICMAIIPLFPSEAPDFVTQTVLTRGWELLHLLFVGIAVSYGLFSRRNDEPDKEVCYPNSTNQSYVSRASWVFDDEGEMGKVQYWSNRYSGQEPRMVVVGEENSMANEGMHCRIPDKPLCLPVRSRKPSGFDCDDIDSIYQDYNNPSSALDSYNGSSSSNWVDSRNDGFRDLNRSSIDSGLNRATKNWVAARNGDGFNSGVLNNLAGTGNEGFPDSGGVDFGNEGFVDLSRTSLNSSFASKRVSNNYLSRYSLKHSSSSNRVPNNYVGARKKEVGDLGGYKSSLDSNLYGRSRSEELEDFEGVDLGDISESGSSSFSSKYVMPRSEELEDLGSVDLRSDDSEDLSRSSSKSISTLGSNRACLGIMNNEFGENSDNVVLPSPIPWRSRSVGIIVNRDSEGNEPEVVFEENEVFDMSSVGSEDDNYFKSVIEVAPSVANDVGPDVDKKADEFIAKFKEQIRLQRMRSFKRCSRDVGRNSS